MLKKILKNRFLSLSMFIFVFLIAFYIPVQVKALSYGATANPYGLSGGLDLEVSANPTTTTKTSLSCTTPKDIGTLFTFFGCLLNGLIPVIIGIAVLMFLIGISQYVTSGDNEEKKAASRDMMIYGIISIFVMVSVWGFVKILSTTFGFDFTLPSLPPSSKSK